MSDNIKRGDEYKLQRILRYDNGTPIDLSNVNQVFFSARKYGDKDVTIQKECEIIDGENGIVSCQFTKYDTAIIGMYRAAWVITGLDTQITVPTTGNYWLHVEENVYPL